MDKVHARSKHNLCADKLDGAAGCFLVEVYRKFPTVHIGQGTSVGVMITLYCSP